VAIPIEITRVTFEPDRVGLEETTELRGHETVSQIVETEFRNEPFSCKEINDTVG
jgi:hypothetical protein